MVLHVPAEDGGSGGQSRLALRQPSHDHGEDAPAAHVHGPEKEPEADFRRAVQQLIAHGTAGKDTTTSFDLFFCTNQEFAKQLDSIYFCFSIIRIFCNVVVVIYNPPFSLPRDPNDIPGYI